MSFYLIELLMMDKGVKFHALEPLDPTKVYDSYEDREVVTYVLLLNITSTTNRDINLFQ